MGVVIGVMVGWVMGSRAGAGSWTEIEEAWRSIASSQEVKDLVSGGMSMARDMVTRRADILVGVLGFTDEWDRLRQAA